MNGIQKVELVWPEPVFGYGNYVSSSFRFLISCPNSACNELGRETDGCLFNDAMSILMRRRSSFREFISLFMMKEETAELVGNCDWGKTGRVVAAGEG